MEVESLSDTLELVFGGRVLKVGKTVQEYKVVSGCTIHVMTIKSKKRESSDIMPFLRGLN